jgi:hypothetical protein
MKRSQDETAMPVARIGNIDLEQRRESKER